MEVDWVDAGAALLAGFEEAGVHEAQVLHSVAHGLHQRVLAEALLEAQWACKVGVVAVEVL